MKRLSAAIFVVMTFSTPSMAQDQIATIKKELGVTPLTDQQLDAVTGGISLVHNNATISTSGLATSGTSQVLIGNGGNRETIAFGSPRVSRHP